MQAPPIPLNEAERIAALERYQLLDTPEEQIYDEFAALAATLLDAPIALVSLVGRDRQWFKARQGIDLTETSRTVSFCAWAVYENASLVVPDARQDPRFIGNPMTEGEDGVRFYAGVPLRTADDYVLGTLCVADTVPREPDMEAITRLQSLARILMQQIEGRRVAAELAAALERARLLSEMIPVCAHCNRVRKDQTYWDTLEGFLQAHTGARISHGICQDCARQHFAE